MDKKNTTIGVLLLMAAFTLMVFQRPSQPPPAQPDSAPAAETDGMTPGAKPAGEEVAEQPSAIEPVTPVPPAEEVEESLVRLENEYFIVEFTNLGGAIKRVYLKEYERTKGSEERYVLNESGELPALGLVDFPGAGPETPFQLVEQTETELTYSARVGDSIEVVRRYRIELEAGRHDPNAYLVHHETIFQNLTGQALLLREFGVHLGTASPTGRRTIGIQHLNFGFFDGDDFDFLTPAKFEGGGFLAWVGLTSGEPKETIQRTMPVVWATVKNQFFTSIFTPETPAKGFIAQPAEVPAEETGEQANGSQEPATATGMTGQMRFDLRGVEAEGQQALAGTFYAGPKEFRRLEALGQEQDRVMQFGWAFIGFISKLLLSMMIAIERWVPNFGVAIILVTVIIKTLLWPLTAASARSSKRMAKIQEPMKALREKYKDDPKKMQMETMKLFKEHKVNPVGGCLPMLVQIPIFFALFRMIMSASELRFAEFLWVQDLSAPDTVAYIFGFPLNILPLFMGVTMFYQMRMMPMAMDNAQQKIFRMMPFIFFIFCYNFSSGLVLYWTVQNLLTILQQFLINRGRDQDEPVPAAGAAGTGSGSAPVQASPYLKKGKGKAKSRKKKE